MKMGRGQWIRVMTRWFSRRMMREMSWSRASSDGGRTARPASGVMLVDRVTRDKGDSPGVSSRLRRDDIGGRRCYDI